MKMKMKIINDNKSHRTYWIKKEITPESVKTTHRDYSLEDFINDLDDVFENIITQTKVDMDRSWNRNTKKSIYYIMVNTGPNLKSIKTVAREQKVPLKLAKGVSKMYWRETEILQAIFEREVENIKKLSSEDQMGAFQQLIDTTNYAGGKFL